MLLDFEEVKVGSGLKSCTGADGGAPTAARYRRICRGSNSSTDIDDKRVPAAGLTPPDRRRLSERLDIVPVVQSARHRQAEICLPCLADVTRIFNGHPIADQLPPVATPKAKTSTP
jgi:hypothetical protein